jgi:carbon monoxide dehydrogenase subunit G
MIFEGDRTFPILPNALWSKMRDARFLVDCIPDTTTGAQAEMDRATCTVRPGFSFVRGSLDLTLEVKEAIEEQLLRFLLTSKGVGSSSEVETTLAFAPQDHGTQVHWRAEIKRLGGLLKAVPAGLIRGAAQKVIEDVWNRLAERIQSN